MNYALVIEDDEVTAQSITTELQAHGFDVQWASTGRDGLAKAILGGLDVITLDRMLPDFDGLTIVSTLRNLGIHTPVLMISALSDVDERVKGLRCGGDDYLTKPFSMVEMVARLEVLLRRPGSHSQVHQLSVGNLSIDLIENTLVRCGESIALLPTEFKLLTYLMRNAGQQVTRTMLFEEVWGYHFDPGTNIIDVHIGRLRKKIEGPGAPLIHTIRGSGYMLATQN
ncbi:response regulator transcription factor [Pseudomonas psychrophila]|jgi:two-component system OmpR family response regulator|uniref:Response regulator receiver domain-containing protein n=1 Tax=Pseudomonas psychrophila TaxID=122355 RepID=A0ABY0VVU9_9PSED|nr:response regulator transcription factor [Pseudomonas psychrophila]KAB0492085.1 response regulator transcription factor [Pseudomonas psychrophila]KMM99272.1 transcriptional regulator [Pseudomonas psychrophila]KOX66710.1 transcriptional regulator [Pseudomonas psychrophila]QIE33248.1 response regulator transcription factor [Pseudomonas psychrophila]WVI99812.1 response regulator transcription factor [Pseudomonas psychrophila]